MSTGEWILIVAAGAATPFVLATVVGSLLPRSHRASRSVTLRQSPETVWAAIANLERLPSWWLMVRSIEPLPAQGGRQRYRQTFANRRGRDQAVDMEVAESKPGVRLVTEIADPSRPFQGRWTYEVGQADGGSRVTVTEEASINRPVARFFFRTLMSRTFFIDSYLRALGQKFGERVEPR